MWPLKNNKYKHMKKIIGLLTICFIMACSSDDSNNESNNGPTFEITLEQDATTADIDEVITITIYANETINRLDISKDGWQTSANLSSPAFGSETNVFVDFESIGNKTISIKATNNNGDVSERSVDVTIEKGDAIKLQELQLNSFFNINETWDDEFSDTDPNRLADVFFVLLKPRLNPFEGTRSIGTPVWYESEVKTNQGDLHWNLQTDNLFIDPNLSLYIAFADDDGGGLVGDLMLGPPFEREIQLSDYISTQENPIPFNEANINLNFDLSVEW